MSFTNYREQAQRFVSHLAAAGQPLNDAARYGTAVVPAQAAPGAGYWRALGVYHLTPEENRGLHNAYVEVIDEQGRRVQNSALRVAWTWEGRDPATQEARPAALEKPESEPVANVPIEKGMRMSVWMDGDGPSDQVTGLSAHHPDEPGPGGELWNSEGHHSFFVLFQRARMADAPVVAPPVTEPVTKPVTGPQPAGAFRFEAWPTADRRITQRFGERPDVYAEHGLAGHEGIDIAADVGAPVFSVAPGVVHMVQPVDDGKPYGIQVRVDHAGGYQTIYAHLSQALVGENQQVAAGQPIGLAGETGNSEGPHLHLTLKQSGAQIPGYTPGIIDPMPFLQPLLDVAPAGPPAPPVAERPLRGLGRVTAPAGLNLRAGPGTGFATRTILAADTLVDVLAAAGEWLRVRSGAQEGYLFAAFVTVSALPAALPTPRPPVAALPAPVPPVTPAGRPLAEADPELYKAWREHIVQGFANNNTMFRRVLNGFMYPYWITVVLYVLLVLVGVGLFILGVWLATAGSQAAAGIVSCGLGVAALLSFFVARPLQALEENLQFITWLGVIYNTYWTRLAVANDTATVDKDVSAATETTIAQIKDLQAQHATLSGRRPKAA